MGYFAVAERGSAGNQLIGYQLDIARRRYRAAVVAGGGVGVDLGAGAAPGPE